MDNLGQIVKETVFWYAANGSNVKTFPMVSAREEVYGVIIIDNPHRRNPSGIMVLARVVDDMVVIEDDNSDRPLYDALIERGVPPEKIIRAYAGEPVPEARAALQIP